MTSPARYSALEAARRLAARELAAEALVRACLEEVEAREAQVGAWACLDPQHALHQAQALDRQALRGPLHGLPLGVKDIFDTVDMPTEYGSPLYAGHRPAWDAACVATARAAGAVILGKTVTTEFAYFQPGKTANPHDPAHTPGGSSSGSAAAVAAFMTPLACGTQTAGSVIRPAAFCGVVGYKPSFGLISRAGVKPFAESLDTVGVFARDVKDAALLASCLAGRAELNVPEGATAPPRIALCRTYEWERAEGAAQAVWEEAGKRLSRAGARVAEVSLPQEFRGLAQAQEEIMACEAAQALAYERTVHAGRLSARLTELIGQGLALPAARYEADLELAQRCRLQLAEVFRDCELIIAPSAVGEAPRGLGATGDPLFNRMWTLLHVPCVHLPFGRGPSGLPLGVQAIGPWRCDAATLAAADWALAALGDFE